MRGLIEIYLKQKWRDATSAGAKPVVAFLCALWGWSTMTAQDLLAGRLVVEVGLAATRPAEFILLKLSHQVPPAYARCLPGGSSYGWQLA